MHRWEKDHPGKKAYSQVSGNMTFKDYFEQMSDQQQRDWLGKGRYDLWKTGNYDIKDFIPPYPDKAFGVKQLKAGDIAAVNGEKETEKQSEVKDTKKTKEELHQENLSRREKQRMIAVMHPFCQGQHYI